MVFMLCQTQCVYAKVNEHNQVAIHYVVCMLFIVICYILLYTIITHYYIFFLRDIVLHIKCYYELL